MQKVILVTLMLFIGYTNATIAQTATFTDVVTLKNGSVMKGIIIEEVPNESITIQSADGQSTLKVQLSDVAKRAKERVAVAAPMVEKPADLPKASKKEPKIAASSSDDASEEGISYVGLSGGLLAPIGNFSSTNWSQQYPANSTSSSTAELGFAGVGSSLGLNGAIFFSPKVPIGIGFSGQIHTNVGNNTAFNTEFRKIGGATAAINSSVDVFVYTQVLAMAGLAIGLPLDARRRIILDARVMLGTGSFATSPIVLKLSSASTTTNTQDLEFKYSASSALAIGIDAGLRFRLSRHFGLGLGVGYNTATYSNMTLTGTVTSNGTKNTPSDAPYKTSVTASNINSTLSLMYCF